MKVLSCSCCDGHCGPKNGCNCPPCQQLDKEEEALACQHRLLPSPSQPIIDSWTWGQQPVDLVLDHSVNTVVFWSLGSMSRLPFPMVIAVTDSIKCVVSFLQRLRFLWDGGQCP
ncbi:hypothetical protein Btru_066141 [Bulinus truncatus]|nr:hypothetical protein Btru_066141 [Bulinus truncatus]